MTVGIIFILLSEDAQPCPKKGNRPGALVKHVVAARGDPVCKQQRMNTLTRAWRFLIFQTKNLEETQQ